MLLRLLAPTAAVATALALCACTTDLPAESGPVASMTASTTPTTTTTTTSGSRAQVVMRTVDGREYRIRVPPGYGPASPAPLVVVLHGHASTGAAAAALFGLGAASDERGFLVAMPTGTRDRTGATYWNAPGFTPLSAGPIDDVAFLDDLITDVKAAYAVDSGRVFVAGHSNGAFMAAAMACNRANQIAAVVMLEGALNQSAAQCRPAQPVSVLQVNGTADATVHYDGGSLVEGIPYPSVTESIARWRIVNACGPSGIAGSPFDGDVNVKGAETTQLTWSCAAGRQVTLWRVGGGAHVPKLTASFTARILEWLLAQTRD